MEGGGQYVDSFDEVGGNGGSRQRASCVFTWRESMILENGI